MLKIGSAWHMCSVYVWTYGLTWCVPSLTRQNTHQKTLWEHSLKVQNRPDQKSLNASTTTTVCLWRLHLFAMSVTCAPELTWRRRYFGPYIVLVSSYVVDLLQFWKNPGKNHNV